MAREWTRASIEAIIADYLRRNLKKLIEELNKEGNKNVSK